MPAIPFILKMIITTLGSSIINLLVKWVMKLLTGPAFEKVLLSLAKEAAQRTDTKVDDEIVAALESKVEPKKPEEEQK